MRVLESEVLFLTVFVLGTMQNKLSADSENVCLQSETYEDTVVVKVMKPKSVTQKKMCWKMRKFFRCDENTVKWTEVNETRVLQRSRIVPKCCSGYTEQAGSVVTCVPSCPEGCLHGTCKAPDTCACASGFQGPRCDKIIQTTSTTEKLPATTSSTFLQPSQTTDKSSIRTETFESENVQVTGTDLVKETTTTIVASTEETTNEITSTDGVGDETPEAVLESASQENETSEETEMPRNVETTTEQLNPSQLVTASEETLEEKIDNLVQHEGGPGNGTSGPLQNLNSEGTEASTSKGTVPRPEAVTESTIPQNDTSWTSSKGFEMNPTRNNPDITTVYNIRIFHFTPGLCLLSVVSVLMIFIGAWWVISSQRKKVRIQMEKKQISFISDEHVKFETENIFGVFNNLDSQICMSDLEMKDVKPVLKTFKPGMDEKEDISTGRYLLAAKK